MAPKHRFHQLLSKLTLHLQKLLRISTVGVRALIINQKDEILLVKHTYRPGWFLPGGGVKMGETLQQAIIREVKEETGLIVQDTPKLIGAYFDPYFGNDYPVLFLIKHYFITASHSPEIARLKWTHYKELPPNSNESTRQRVREYFYHESMRDTW